MSSHSADTQEARGKPQAFRQVAFTRTAPSEEERKQLQEEREAERRANRLLKGTLTFSNLYDTKVWEGAARVSNLALLEL